MDLFTRTQEGYHTYRIPALAVATDGTLIVIVEGRRDEAHDPGRGHIDLVYKRSSDGGKTWSKLEVLHQPPEGWGASNPTTVLLRETGRLLVFFNVWMEGRGSRNSAPGERHNQVWVRHSDDHGRTWSEPREITEAVRDIENWRAVVMGPGTGAELGGGRFAVPAYAHQGEDIRSFAIISEDAGQTFRRGERIGVLSGECQIIRLDDRRLLMDARQRDGEHRWIVTSEDGGGTWSEPRSGTRATPVNTSIVRVPADDAETPSWLIWSGPRGPVRNNLVIRISRDEGRTFPHERLIAEGRAAYSSMAPLPEGDVGLVWERGQAENVPGGTVPETITFVRLPREWLKAAATE
jgi:sialidase-1